MIVKSFGTSEPENFASAAVLLDKNGHAYHAGIIVKFANEYKLLHYPGPGQPVLFIDVPVYEEHNWYYHRQFVFVDEFLVMSFFAHCEMVAGSANPKYGFVFPDSFYQEGNYITKNGVPEYMTCVGFCLNVIQGFNPKETYIDYTDWDWQDIPMQQVWVDQFIVQFKVDFPHFSDEDILKFLKRVSPAEYLTSAFYTHRPILKAHINVLLPSIKETLLGYYE